MKLIKPYYEIIEQQPGEIGMLKHIEAQGRVAWKSEDRITEDSYIKFIDMLKGVNHGSVLEHGTIYLKTNNAQTGHFYSLKDKYLNNKYSKVIVRDYPYDKSNRDIIFAETFITTNYRVLVENGWLDDLKYQCEPTEFHEKRITIKFICDRGVSHEFVRHRVFSFTQESTRYCNYSKDKFGNELTYIIPCWFGGLKESTIEERAVVYGEKAEDTNGWHSSDDNENNWVISLLDNEITYFDLINKGWKPQQARSVLPNSLKTELIMTGFESDWKHFIALRTAPGAHPQAQELAIPLQEEFKHLGLL